MEAPGVRATKTDNRRHGITTRRFTDGSTFPDVGGIPEEPVTGNRVPGVFPWPGSVTIASWDPSGVVHHANLACTLSTTV